MNNGHGLKTLWIFADIDILASIIVNHFWSNVVHQRSWPSADYSAMSYRFFKSGITKLLLYLPHLSMLSSAAWSMPTKPFRSTWSSSSIIHFFGPLKSQQRRWSGPPMFNIRYLIYEFITDTNYKWNINIAKLSLDWCWYLVYLFFWRK